MLEGKSKNNYEWDKVAMKYWLGSAQLILASVKCNWFEHVTVVITATQSVEEMRGNAKDVCFCVVSKTT